MIFNSYLFILLFLPIALLGYFLLGKIKKYDCTKPWLILCSCIFYGYIQWKCLAALLIGSLVSFTIVRIMRKSRQPKTRKTCAILGVVINIAYLLVLKYFDFFQNSTSHIFDTNILFPQWMVPMGIGFIMLHQISYIVDIYKNEDLYCSFAEYFLYIVFFPKLVSGPIITYKNFLPQIRNRLRTTIDYNNMVKGLTLFSYGLGKKALVADTFLLFVESGYEHLSSLTAISALVVMISYTIQLYFDFSGYSDMARGVAQMFNFELPVNFNSPLKAVSVTDLWRRWHITLNQFLMEYVYFPLGGSKRGKYRTYFNIMVIFFISGLWHDVSGRYIIWGCLNGLFVVIERLTNRRIEKKPWLGRIFTFLFTCFAFINFSAASIPEVGKFISRFAHFQDGISMGVLFASFNENMEITLLYRFGLSHLFTSFPALPVIILLISTILFCFFAKNTQEIIADNKYGRMRMIKTVLLLCWSIVSFSNVSSFIYSVF